MLLWSSQQLSRYFEADSASRKTRWKASRHSRLTKHLGRQRVICRGVFFFFLSQPCHVLCRDCGPHTDVTERCWEHCNADG